MWKTTSELRTSAACTHQQSETKRKWLSWLLTQLVLVTVVSNWLYWRGHRLSDVPVSMTIVAAFIQSFGVTSLRIAKRTWCPDDIWACVWGCTWDTVLLRTSPSTTSTGLLILSIPAVLLLVWHVWCSYERQHISLTQLKAEVQQATEELATMKAAAAQHASKVQGLQAASYKQAEGERQELTTAIKNLQEQLERIKTQMEALEHTVSEGHIQPIKAGWGSSPPEDHSVGLKTASSASQSDAALDTTAPAPAPATSFGEHPANKCDESISGTDSIEAKREILEHLMAVGARLTEKQDAQRQAAKEEAARVAAEASRVAAEAARVAAAEVAEAEAVQAALRQAAAEEAARVAAAEASKAEAVQRQAAEEEAARVAALEGSQAKATQAVQRQAAAEEASRVAAEAARVAAAEAAEAEAAQDAQRQAAAAEAARVAAEEEAFQAEAAQAKARLANCAQRIMKLTEAAMEADLEAASAFTHPSSIDSTPAGTAVLQLVLQNLARLLGVVDYLKGMGCTAGAIGALSLVLALAQLVGLPLQDQANFLMRRALLCKANGQPFAAFTNCLHAAQLCPESEASLEVMAQLGRWGEYSLLRCFQDAVRAVWAVDGKSESMEFTNQAAHWRQIRHTVTRVLARTLHKGVGSASRQMGETLLAQLAPLLWAHPHHQPLACMKAKQELYMGRFGDAVATLGPFLGGDGMLPSRWAVHMYVRIQWLTGDIYQMVEGLKVLINLEQSPLEGNVAHSLPSSAVLSDLLPKLLSLQSCWDMFARLTQQGDLTAAGQVLSEVESEAAGLFSPALRAHQLCRWAGLARNHFMLATWGSKQSAQWVLKALCFCEWARALAPAMWRQALGIQVETYHHLGSGPPAFLYAQMASEEEASLEERAQYRLLEVAAQACPDCADGGSLDPARPRVNPAFLLGVAPHTEDTVVSMAHNAHETMCYRWLQTATGFADALEGVGQLCGPIALQAARRLEDANATRQLLHVCHDLLTYVV